MERINLGGNPKFGFMKHCVIPVLKKTTKIKKIPTD